ncbi:MAG: aminotransferase class III-fold pyridoxal phosphate-dependent enzyme [Candidatus Aminicenantes bacterium]|nr:aminotransferase class III-fold pyridoxal phosphate-dependent enzyme [Candidatus Aminicenantes bacterium]
MDRILTSERELAASPRVPNLAALVFEPLAHRDERSEIVISHDGPALVRVSLQRLRFVVSGLMGEFRKRGIEPGTTVLLASVSGGSEMFTALTFTALAAYGARVLLPMFVETGPLEEWLDLAGCAAVVVPERDIAALERHDKEKGIVRAVKEAAARRSLPCFDPLADFDLRGWLGRDVPEAPDGAPLDPEAVRALGTTSHTTEALIVTTSGTSGRSKLYVYEQGAFIRSCLSWQAAGFYAPDKLGGRGFTPLFTHTMGIRAYFNALWTGSPVCLINTEWFEEKPETVRYFLLRMLPEHLTGGPAVYNLLLELARTFPELKDRLKSSLKVAVMSGARGDGRTAAAVESAFGLVLHNAFGMTETQQVLSTLLFEDPRPEDLRSLGRSLPGVSIGLVKVDGGPNLYRLFVKSPFGCKAVLGDPAGNGAVEGFLDTGDIVRLGGEDRLFYEGRDGRDFIKDGFGVKIPLASMADHYAALHGKASHVEYFPMRDSPGLAALVFSNGGPVGPAAAGGKAALRDLSKLVAETNTRLYETLEPFEFRHRVIRRLALTEGPAPRTVKGNVSRYRIEVTFRETIAGLTDPQALPPGVEACGDLLYASGKFSRFLNPYVGGMLAGLRLDHSYHRAEKDSLFAFEAGREVEVLDLVGGFGTNLLGHGNREIRTAAVSFLESGDVPLSDQGSIQEHAGRLAAELASMVGEATGRDYGVLLASSGSEAVEMALHHAALEWKKRLERMEEEQLQRFGDAARALRDENRRALRGVRPAVVTLKDAFHGSSSGPRSLLGSDEQRGAFGNLSAFERIPVDDRSPSWEEGLERRLAGSRVDLRRLVADGDGWRVETVPVSTVIAAVVEPVIGEGGVREVDPEVLRRLGRFDFPLIIDEIQCGLGRTGSFLASQGVVADYCLFGKALGGGIEKIAAVAIDKKRFRNEIGKYYVSTFANGGLAARVALKSLAVIRADDVPGRARRQGEKLREKLEAVRAAFPGVIDAITGRGLMLGVRFADFSGSGNILLRTLTARKMASYAFASYLLRRRRVRVLPTLSAPDALRLEPSAYVNDEEIDRAAAAFGDLARTIDARRTYDLFLALMDGDPFDDNKGRPGRPGLVPSRIEAPAENASQVAFIAHFSRPAEELRIIDPDLSRASDTGLRILFNRLQSVMEMKPFVLFAKNLCRGRVHFSFVILPADSAELERLHRLGKTRRIVACVQEAVDLAARGGAKVIGLGGYASILSRNGTALAEPEGTRIITGNTLTAASGIRRLTEEIGRMRGGQRGLTLGIVGASGNIGAIVTECLLATDGLFSRVILADRKPAKIEAFADGLDRGGFRGTLETACGLGTLRACDVIAVAANTNDPIIFPHHLKQDGPVLVADVSIPPALAPQVARMPNVRTLPFASYVSLPDDPDFVISSHTPKGAVFCCAGEVILCGLESPDVPLKGRITSAAIRSVTELARKYGFFKRLGAVESFRPKHIP